MPSTQFARMGLAFIALVFSIAGTAQEWVQKSDEITRTVLNVQLQFNPEAGTSLGMQEFDELIRDLQPDIYERTRAANLKLIDRVAASARTVEHPKVLQDLQILQQALRDEVVTEKLNHDHLLPYYNLSQYLFFAFRNQLDPRSEPARYPAALVRLKKYTGIAAGYEPLTELAKARTEERFADPALTGPFRGELERDLNNVQRFSAGLEQTFSASGLEGWQDDLAVLQAQLLEYADWIREEILPRAREDHRLPAEIYADNLKGFGVRAEPDELIRAAQFGYQEIRGQMRSLARQIANARGWENGDLVWVMHELKKEQIPPGEILEVYKNRLSAIEDIIRREQIVTLPDRAANIRLATDAESSAIPAPFMSPPQLINNTGQYGEFVLVQKNPSMEEGSQMDDWSHQSMTWALTVHEARPGHEMQFASLVENGTSLARSTYAFNSANVEGWGLYSEAIMNEYLPLEGQLFTLMARLQRAARMFMDPMVNLGRMTPEEAVSFMIREIGLSEAMARSEADRYAFLAPGQATSYYYGYMSLQRLRTEVELKLGDRFNQRKYHDFVLEQGLLPPDLLRKTILEDFIPAQ